MFSGKPFRTTVAVLAFVALAAAYAFLPLSSPPRSASPDENANLHFSRLFADTGTLWQFDSINLQAKGAVHPRSMRVAQDFIVPGGFIGLPVLYGGIAALLGNAVLPYLTPIVAVLAVVAWGVLVTHLFGRRIGVLAAFLLAFHPVWWYETARTMQPNVLFVALIIFSLWCFLTQPIHGVLRERTKFRLSEHIDPALAGTLLAFALAVRPSEAYWLIMAAAIVAFSYRATLPWRRLAVAAVFTVLTIAPFVMLNASAYGSPFATGYGAAGDAPVIDLPQGQGAALLSSVLGPFDALLFPLGFAPADALRHFTAFGIGIVWWWAVLVGCAFVALAADMRRLRASKEKPPRVALTFAALAAVISVWLILFYGSWTIRDNPDPNAVTIGSSYLRYWLPIYVLSTVPVAWLFNRASQVLRGGARTAAVTLFVAMYLLSGATDVFLSPQEGLIATRASLYDSDEKARQIIVATPETSVIVVDRADKYLFPERRVIVPLRSEATYSTLGRLRTAAPLYYFGISFPERDLAWLRDTKLPPLGLSIVPVLTIGEETLYRFDPLDDGGTVSKPAKQ